MKIVAIANCPNGMAHTYMAAEALEKAAKELGVEIKVETQGAIGVENGLTPEEIRGADCVLLATGVAADKSRFTGKRILDWPVSNIVQEAGQAIQSAMDGKGSVYESKEPAPVKREKKTGFTVMEHFMTGISYMVPIVAAGGLLIAISMLWGINQPEGSLGALINSFGGAILSFMVPVLAAGIAYSIGDKPAITPGLFIGYFSANVTSSGFLGALIGGLLVGYMVRGLKKISLPRALQGIHAVLFIPLLTCIAVGLLFNYVIGAPIAALMTALTDMLTGMSTTSMVLLGIVMGLMTAFDMGGPCDKVAYSFSVGLLAEGITAPMAANMAAGMSPALGLALATVLFKNRFTGEERDAGKVAWAMGACFITEGAIPFAAADPLRVLPATMLGSAVTGALSMLFGCTLNAPHGGIFSIIIPGVVNSPFLYILAVLAGTVVTALTVGFTKTLGKKKSIREGNV